MGYNLYFTNSRFMTITEIKNAVSVKLNHVNGTTSLSYIGTLSMVRQFDEVDGVKTPSVWVSHWDNDHRIRITMHEDIMNSLKSNKDKSDLAFKYELVTPSDKAPYHRFVVITPRDIEATF